MVIDPIVVVAMLVPNMISDVAHGRFVSAFLERPLHAAIGLVALPLARLWLAGTSWWHGTGVKLSEHQKELLHKHFGPNFNVDSIRVVPNGPPPFINSKNTAITLGNTIFINGDLSKLSDELLLHEATHVLQYRSNGPDYATRAFAHGQIAAEKYNVAFGFVRGKEHWGDFGLEQQAELMEMIQKSGFDPNDPQKAHLYASPSFVGWASAEVPSDDHPHIDPVTGERVYGVVDMTKVATEAYYEAQRGRAP